MNIISTVIVIMLLKRNYLLLKWYFGPLIFLYLFIVLQPFVFSVKQFELIPMFEFYNCLLILEIVFILLLVLSWVCLGHFSFDLFEDWGHLFKFYTFDEGPISLCSWPPLNPNLGDKNVEGLLFFVKFD